MYSRKVTQMHRHANFPTTDIPIEELPVSHEWFKKVLHERVYPFLAAVYPELVPDPEDLRIFDVFVVKYDSAAGGQRRLNNHR
jgi:hypothetical protein